MHQSFSLPSEQKEQARHGEHLFPLKKYITVLSQPHPNVTAHWHDEAEFTRIKEGTCVCHVGLNTFAAGPGDFLFLPPTVLHAVSLDSCELMTSETYVFHMNFLGAGTADICSVRYLTPIVSRKLELPCLIGKDHPAYIPLQPLFHSINETYEARLPGYELMLRAELLQVISLLLPYADSSSDRSSTENEHIAKLKLVLEYIDENYAEDLSVAQLARLCYFSEYHFMRFFKKYTGISCIEYIKNKRLEKAAELFITGNDSILDTAMSCGFSNLSYFYREFRKKYGITPGKFIEEKPDIQRFSPHGSK